MEKKSVPTMTSESNFAILLLLEVTDERAYNITLYIFILFIDLVNILFCFATP